MNRKESALPPIPVLPAASIPGIYIALMYVQKIVPLGLLPSQGRNKGQEAPVSAAGDFSELTNQRS